MRKRIIIIISIVIVLAIGVITAILINKPKSNNDTKPNNDPIKNEEKKAVAVFGLEDGLYTLNNDASMSKLVSQDKFERYMFDVSGDKLYYIDKDSFIHSVSLNNSTDTNLNIKVSDDTNEIAVDRNYLIADVNSNQGHILRKYNLQDGSVEDLSISSNNSSLFINGTFYYSDSDSLYYYIADSQEIGIIANDARIVSHDSNHIVYAIYEMSGKQITEEYYLYNMNDKTSKKLNITSDNMDDLILIGDKIYYIIKRNATLYQYDINSNDSKKIELGYNVEELYADYELFKLNQTLMLKGSFALKETCKMDDCPGYKKIYFYQNNNLQEKSDIDSLLKEDIFGNVIYVK